ncbi:ribonuclease J [Spiroplasma endosymbiont of Aspidapion aeneum]|uniref:ribonuclease J n=1 Tax=Spiroplasma endosymbiont of Aspidapion aeneum TaxID=3066276 RepID=UPI00313CB875
MANVKIIPLGGQDERGKNSFILCVDEDLYVFDMGLKLPESSILGVDVIISNYDFLYKNADKIKGIFISNGSTYNAGGLQYFLRKVSAPIYCNEFTEIILRHKNIKIRLEHQNSNINIIKDGDIVEFANLKIDVFKSTASFPNSLNYAIYTPEGLVVYLSDFIYDGEEKDFFSPNFSHIQKIASDGVSLLLIDSEYASRQGFTSPNHKLDKYLPNIIREKKRRALFAIFEEDIFNLYAIVKEAIATNKKICLYGNLLNQISDIVIEKSGLDKNAFISPAEYRESDNATLIIAASGDLLYAKLTKIAVGNDEFIKLKESDIVILATPPAPGVERRHADTLDELSRTSAKIISLSDRNLWSMRASYEDVKLAISMISPKKVIPIKGLYKDFVATKRAAIECGLTDYDILILENGDALTFKKGPELGILKETLKIDDIFVDGVGIGDLSDTILYERKMLGTDGVVIIGVNVDYNTKLPVSLVDTQMRGITSINDDGILINLIQEILLESLAKYAAAYKESKEYNLNFIKKDILSKIKGLLKKEIRKQPIVLLIVNELRSPNITSRISKQTAVNIVDDK